MTSSSGSARDGVLPRGDALQRAIRWISQRRVDEPTTPLPKILDEAALRFDLTPSQAEGLHQTFLGG